MQQLMTALEYIAQLAEKGSLDMNQLLALFSIIDQLVDGKIKATVQRSVNMLKSIVSEVTKSKNTNREVLVVSAQDRSTIFGMNVEKTPASELSSDKLNKIFPV